MDKGKLKRIRKAIRLTLDNPANNLTTTTRDLLDTQIVCLNLMIADAKRQKNGRDEDDILTPPTPRNPN